MDIGSRSIKLAQSGQYATTEEIESALLKEYEYTEVKHQFNSLSFKRMIGDMIRDALQKNSMQKN